MPEHADDPLFPHPFVSREEIMHEEIAAFESALDEARDERDMQRFLEANPGILIQQIARAPGAWVIPKKRLGSEHETDFVIAQKVSGGIEWLAVELERPQAKMFNKNGDPSAALTHALRQISDWRDWLSQNRDYAVRPPERSGLGLIDIDPELEGLIIIGRAAEIDERATVSRRRRLERINRVKIETYDWLLSQAKERLDALEGQIRTFARGFVAAVGEAFLSNPPLQEPVKRAVNDVFGGTATGWAKTGVLRGEVEWEGVELWPDAHPDDNGIAPLRIVYAQGTPAGRLLQRADWIEWIDHVKRSLDAKYSLVVTEIAPSEDLQQVLTLEIDGIWSFPEWLMRPTEGTEMRVLRLDVLAHLPLAFSYADKRKRVADARDVFQRYIALDRERELEQTRKAEFKVRSLSLTPGDHVEHDKFGLGIVVSVTGADAKAEAAIDFGSEFGIKHLVLRFAPLKKPY